MLGGSVAEPMCWVGGWLDQVGIRLTQLSTGLKVEAELGNITVRGVNEEKTILLVFRPM